MMHASLFSGIGAAELAAEWMGWENVFHCEIEEFPRTVLQYHFPEEHSIEDVHDLTFDDYGNLIHLKDDKVIVMGQKRSSKYDHAVELYNSGYSIADCAKFYEISRQAMHKILERRGCVFRDNKKYGSDNHFYRGVYGNKTKKKRVQHLVEKAIKRGDIINPNVCQECGSSYKFKDGRTAIQAHHCDYDKPYEIMWLCQRCHHKWHKENKVKNEKDIEKQGNPSGAVDIVSGGFPC